MSEIVPVSIPASYILPDPRHNTTITPRPGGGWCVELSNVDGVELLRQPRVLLDRVRAVIRPLVTACARKNGSVRVSDRLAVVGLREYTLDEDTGVYEVSFNLDGLGILTLPEGTQLWKDGVLSAFSGPIEIESEAMSKPKVYPPKPKVVDPAAPPPKSRKKYRG